MNKGYLCKTFIIALILGLISTTRAEELRLPHIFGSHMVLQQDKPVTIWGWAGTGESVTVSIAGHEQTTTANQGGEWKVSLPAMKASSTPVTVTVTGKKTLTLEDVLIGEVWLGSGQSNMEMGMAMVDNATNEIAAANYPQIRILLVKKALNALPQTDVDATWKVCTPKSIVEGGWGGFSAAAYFFGRELHKSLQIPVGMIESSWGGTPIDAWIPVEGFASSPALKDIPARNKSAKINASYPAVLYNAMIHPLEPLSMRGIIWYQGESNRQDGKLYTEKTRVQVECWRKLFGQPELPYYYTLIAPYQYKDENPEIVPVFWEAQTAALAIPNTGMIVTTDIGNKRDIHPKNKQEVGRRLALLALAKTYGKSDLVCSGPVYKSFAIEGSKIRVTFDNAEGGLMARDGKDLTNFEIGDADKGGFVPATAVIDGTSVVLAAAGVTNPVAVRFAWHKLAEPNLSNKAGLPATPFRAGKELSRLPVTKELPRLSVTDETKEQRDQRMKWFREAKFGMFIHWGLYAVPAGTYDGKKIGGIGEWIMNRGKIPVDVYAKYAGQFNPVKFNAEEWVKIAKDAGVKYIVITSKHHDGFAMFKSAASPYNIFDATPYHKDPLKDLAAACEKEGIRLGFYYSQAQDWHHRGGAAAGGHWDKAAQDGDMTEYIKTIVVPQLTEILSNYGKVSVLWFDTPTGMTKERADLILPVLKLQPGIIWNNRLGGGYKGDTETPEQHIPVGGFKDGRDWETCMTMNDTWGFKSDDNHWKSAEVLLFNLIDIASKGGNYLLNVGPTAEGLIPQPSVERLARIGEWMKVNSEAIYGTGPTCFGAEYGGATQAADGYGKKRDTNAGHDWRCTTKSNKIYFHLFKWPGATFEVAKMKGKAVKAYMLADRNTALKVTQEGDKLTVALPAVAPDKIASVLCVEVE